MPPISPPRGILALPPLPKQINHTRWKPTDALTPYIAHIWSVVWSVAEPFTAQTIPHPSAHIVLDSQEETEELIAVRSDAFSRTLYGEGTVVGFKFRPAMSFSLTQTPHNTLRDARIPIHTYLPDLPRGLFSSPRAQETLQTLTHALCTSLHPPTAQQCALRDLLERIAIRPSPYTAKDLARHAGWSIRTLQRRCALYVGLSPKQILQRYRLIETAEHLRSQPINIAQAAVELEYSDQAHLTHTFRRFTGHTPSAFVASTKDS